MNEFLAQYSYFAITLVLILTGSGLPIPEEVPIIWAGVMSAPPDAKLNWLIALPCCLVGALVGDCIMYWIGYHFGRSVLREHRWWGRCVTPEREERIEHMFQRHGFKVFFVARFLVGLRSPVYLTAGILRVSFKKFLMIDLICATSVVGSFFGLAYFFGFSISKWIKRGEWGLTIIAVIALTFVGIYLWRRYRQKKSLLPPTPMRLVDKLVPPEISPAGEAKVEDKEGVEPSRCDCAEAKREPSSNGDGKKPGCCSGTGDGISLNESKKGPV